MFKTLPIENAIGSVLAHDVTEIRKGEFKGPAFRKGHVIQSEDICRFLRMGKRQLYVLDIEDGYLHEDDAAVRMAEAVCGEGVVVAGTPREGKLNLTAARGGLLKVDVEALAAFNLLGEVMCATRHTNTVVTRGDLLAGTRAIPLVLSASVVDEAVHIASAAGGLLRVLPIRSAKVGLVITGSEVFSGMIEDRFESVLRGKIDKIGSSVVGVAFAPDDPAAISEAIIRMRTAGADFILTTGGMSVDPDDVTREGIRLAGGSAECYGAPVLPGAMFMMADLNGTTVLGIPACGLYHETTIFDLVLPRVLAGESLQRDEIARMGHGGLCLNCTPCRFPRCGFGKSA